MLENQKLDLTSTAAAQVDKEVASLRQYKMSLMEDDSDARESCVKAEVHLLEYRKKFLEKYEYTMNKWMEKLPFTMSNEVQEPVYVHPRLIIQGEPALQLFLYNIRIRISKNRIRKFLETYVTAGAVEVVKVHCNKKGTSAVLRCNDIEVSTILQTKACLKELNFTYNNGVPSNVHIKPCEYFEQLSQKGAPKWRKSSECPESRPPEFEPSFAKFLNCKVALALVADFAGSEDFLRLYDACCCPEYFEDVPVDFDSAMSRYSGALGHQTLFEDAATFKFRTAKFRTASIEMNSALVSRALTHQYKRDEFYKTVMKVLDVSEVRISPNISTILSEKFIIDTVRLGPIPDIFDHKLRIEGVKQFHIRDNYCYRASSLLNNCFMALHTINIHSCRKLVVRNIYDFVVDNRQLKSLSVTDCSFIDKMHHMDILFEAVFSNGNVIEEFNFSYGKHAANYGPEFAVPVIKGSDCMRILRLRNNTYAERLILNIVTHSPKLEILDIEGVTVPIDFKLESNLFIKTLTMNYFENMNVVLIDISKRDVDNVHIINTFGTSTIVPLDINFIFNMLHNRKQFYVRLDNCNVNISPFAARGMQNRGVEIVKREQYMIVSRA